MKLKRIFINLVLMFVTINVFPQGGQFQSPCEEIVTEADSAKIAVGRFDDIINKVRKEDAPKIDGFMDRVWSCSNHPTELHSFGESPYGPMDPGFCADIRYLYDSSWLYLFVNVFDDDLLLEDSSGLNIDHLEFKFQNTWGGLSSTSFNHCNKPNWWFKYWKQDGDKSWIIPSNKDLFLSYDDYDLNEDCIEPPEMSFNIDASGWLTLGVLKQVLFEVDTTKLDDNLYQISYEMAFNFRNWLGFNDSSNLVSEGHQLGLEIAIVDIDSDGSKTKIEISESSGYEWCSPIAISKFTLGSELLSTHCSDYFYLRNYMDEIFCYEIPDNIKINEQENLLIFPNPANSFISLNSKIGISFIEIVNLMGQVVIKSNEIESTINISSLESGVYILKAYSGNELLGVEQVLKE